jgi:hypothetical protein
VKGQRRDVGETVQLEKDKYAKYPSIDKLGE